VPFYVPVGRRRGFLMRFGMVLIGVFGSASYWWASLRRDLAPACLAAPLEAELSEA
jgi:hypothetical protein